MLYWDRYNGHDKKIVGKRKKFDNNIYSFDIETSSYFLYKGEIKKAVKYLDLKKSDKKNARPMCSMYIWMFGINDIVYYGRTWDELKKFLQRLDLSVSETKYVFVHNLAFEFQFLKSQFHFTDVMARKSHKVMTAKMADYNIIFKCSYMMSNCALAGLPKLFKLPVEKKVGDLDYDLIRTSITPLSSTEYGYCEYDCLVVYHYILRELETYEDVKHIPTTSTGKVRRELQDLIRTNFKYKRIVRKAINVDPHVYNLLQDAFMGGYTHSNWIFTDEIIKNVSSFDEASAYPYVLVTCKFPSKAFRRCYITKKEEMSRHFAYLLVVRFKHVRCKYFNNFISSSKCRHIKGADYDNGRIISALEFEITITDIDFRFFIDTYECQYEILESYFSMYNYLPLDFINFVLEKYEKKTIYKGDETKELEYQKEKGLFNSLYGMSVTNNIRDTVEYSDSNGSWAEIPLTNEEIEKALISERNKAFLSFAYGVWVTAYARDNLLRRLIELDDYQVYADTDSLKLKEGFDKRVIDKYNESVLKKLHFCADIFKIDYNKFAPKDIKGVEHPLGVFEMDGVYHEFVTQGAKKYAYTKWIKNEKLKDKKDVNIIETKDDESLVLEITVAGVPKKLGAMALKDLSDFKDDFVFTNEICKKKLLFYAENQPIVTITDYLGFTHEVSDISGCSIMPNEYTLGKSLEYANLISDNSSHRARYRE